MKTKFALPALLLGLSLATTALAQKPSNLPRSKSFDPKTEISQDSLEISFKNAERQLPPNTDIAPDVKYVREQLKQTLKQYGDVDSTATTYEALRNGSIAKRVRYAFKPMSHPDYKQKVQVVVTSLTIYGPRSNSEEFNAAYVDVGTGLLAVNGHILHITTANTPINGRTTLSTEQNGYSDCVTITSKNGFDRPEEENHCVD